MIATLRGLHARFSGPLRWVDAAAAVVDLGLRLYLAQVFLLAGLTKLRDWETTVALFTDEYHVPLLPPALAAAMGTAGELVLPVLLVAGLFGRFAAAGLFVVNLVAAISYPDIAPLALKDHWLWGVLLLVLAFHGPGRLSADAWLFPRRLPPR
jgi:putative oxidoreductase